VVLLQPKKEVEDKYAARDAADAERAGAAVSIDPNDKKAAMKAQADSEARLMAEQLGVSTTAPPEGLVIFGGQEPKSKADFEKYAGEVAKHYGAPHAKNKQYRVFVKALVKALCSEMEPEGIKEVETTLAGLRSDKLKEARQAASGAKKGTFHSGDEFFAATSLERPHPVVS
jgi:translation initiation factor 3 subunit J